MCRVSRSWDGEEYGLLGSVEFVEKHAHILNAQAVAYINVDFGVKGTTTLQAKGTLSPLYSHLFFLGGGSSSTHRHIVVGGVQARRICRACSPRWWRR